MLTVSTPLGHLVLKVLKQLAVCRRQVSDAGFRAPHKTMPKATRIRASRKTTKSVRVSAAARNGGPVRRGRGRPPRSERGSGSLEGSSLVEAQQALGSI